MLAGVVGRRRQWTGGFWLCLIVYAIVGGLTTWLALECPTEQGVDWDDRGEVGTRYVPAPPPPPDSTPVQFSSRDRNSEEVWETATCVGDSEGIIP